MSSADGSPCLRWRQGTTADMPQLAALYARSARGIGPARYSAQQVAVWSSFGEDLAGITAWLEGSEVLLALDDAGSAIGFVAVDAAGHVRALYLEPASSGAGLGLQLLQLGLSRAQARGITMFHAEATLFSRPVFERAGFRLVTVECSEYLGVRFERHCMSSA